MTQVEQWMADAENEIVRNAPDSKEGKMAEDSTR